MTAAAPTRGRMLAVLGLATAVHALSAASLFVIPAIAPDMAKALGASTELVGIQVAIVYFDSSAFVKLFVEEAGSTLAIDLWNGCDVAVASRLAYAEVCAALALIVRTPPPCRHLSGKALVELRGAGLSQWAQGYVLDPFP